MKCQILFSWENKKKILSICRPLNKPREWRLSLVRRYGVKLFRVITTVNENGHSKTNNVACMKNDCSGNSYRLTLTHHTTINVVHLLIDSMTLHM